MGNCSLRRMNRHSEACITHSMAVNPFTFDGKGVYHSVIARGREVPTTPRKEPP